MMRLSPFSIGLSALMLVAVGCNKPSTPSATPDSEPATATEPAQPAHTGDEATPPAAVTTEPSTEPSSPAAAHPADAREFGGHWYKAFDEDIPWHDAKKRCEELGGYLVCIETQAEQEFIANLCDGRYLYLGATDEKEEDTWVWINGSKWEYTAWMDGQPNNYGEDEHYLATYDGGEWVDVAADGDGFWMPTGFICEWDK